MLSQFKTYESALKDFKWDFNFTNIAYELSEKWIKDKNKIAIIDENLSKNYTFYELDILANKLANFFLANSFLKEDKVIILLGQNPETIISHLACFKTGLISIPIFPLFGIDAISYRVNDSKAKILITTKDIFKKLKLNEENFKNLKIVLIDDPNYELNFTDIFINYDDTLDKKIHISPNDKAIVIYTSGTTGNPKGAVLSQKVLYGHIPGIYMSHAGVEKNDLYWTPADWSWIGGLFDLVFFSLFFGKPVVCKRFKKFNASETYYLIKKNKIKNIFFPPTAIKILMAEIENYDWKNLKVRSIASGGESLGEHTRKWVKQKFGIEINEFYGQTECNMIVSENFKLFPHRKGSMGKAVPGHKVDVINEKGQTCNYLEEGEIAVRSPDPVMFSFYLNNKKATQKKYIGNWMLTGDRGYKDEDNYLYFIGRNDDVINASGYRIGPGPIENLILQHDKVENVGVVGISDPKRGQVVKAFVKLKSQFKGSKELEEEIKLLVKNKLGAHEYPRYVEFIRELPMTRTGKIKRNILREI